MDLSTFAGTKYSLCFITSTLTHSLAYSYTMRHPISLSFSFSWPTLSCSISLAHTFSENIHAQSTYYPFCSFGPVYKKSFGWFYSLALVFKHRHICESAKVNSYSLLTTPHHTTKQKRTMCSN